MKRMVAVLLGLAVLATVAAPAPAIAHSRFWGGFAVGGLTGLILGGALVAPYRPPVVVYPAPPQYVAPPYYAPAPGYGTGNAVWVPPQWVWNGYQWVWQPGYWRYY
jgi:hypothetical protein